MSPSRKLIAFGVAAVLFTVSFVVVEPRHVSAQVDEGLLGPFVDELVWTQQPDPNLALDAIIAGEQDVSMNRMREAAQKQRAVDSPEVRTVSAFDRIGGILMNAAEFQPGLAMNPFSDEGMREAIQWLIDRDVVVQDAYAGFAIPFSGPFHPLSQDWFREQATFEALAAEYSFDFARAQAQIDSRMAALGAVRAGPENTWHDSDGMEIVIIVLARVEDERAAVGSYVASQLQAVGFNVDLQIVPSRTAIPLVYGSDATLGSWYLYTELFASPENIPFDDSSLQLFHSCFILDLFCAANGGTLELDPTYLAKVQVLGSSQYTSLAERQQLIREIASGTVDHGGTFDHANYRMWLTAVESIFPLSERVDSLVSDPFEGPFHNLFVKGLKLKPGEPGVRADGTGGTVRIQNFFMFVSPFHPWDPFPFQSDQIQLQAIGDLGMVRHPETGVGLDYRVTTEVETAGPVGGPMSLMVPEDALIWELFRDSAGNIVGAGDKFVSVGPGVTAASRVTTHLGDMGNWHTGLDITMADVVYSLANAYRRSFGDIAAVDPTTDDGFTPFFLDQLLKGVRFDEATNTVEAWIDFWHPDPKEIALTGHMYLGGSSAPVSWEVAEVAMKTILDGKTAFTEHRAFALGLPLLDLAKGESLPFLDAALNELRTAGHIPIGLSAFITPQEAEVRYASLAVFRETFGHYYASNGPFLLTSVDTNVPETRMEAFRVGVYAPTVITVEIDVKPGSDPNSINCNGEEGVIPIAILTTDDFDATTVDHTTVTFEGASETHADKRSGELRRHEEDVDGDGDIDLVLHFRFGDTGLTCNSTEGTLTGSTFDGQAIGGSDSVRMVPQG